MKTIFNVKEFEDRKTKKAHDTNERENGIIEKAMDTVWQEKRIGLHVMNIDKTVRESIE